MTFFILKYISRDHEKYCGQEKIYVTEYYYYKNNNNNKKLTLTASVFWQLRFSILNTIGCFFPVTEEITDISKIIIIN